MWVTGDIWKPDFQFFWIFRCHKCLFRRCTAVIKHSWTGANRVASLQSLFSALCLLSSEWKQSGRKEESKAVCSHLWRGATGFLSLFPLTPMRCCLPQAAEKGQASSFTNSSHFNCSLPLSGPNFLSFTSLLDWFQEVCIHLQKAKKATSNSHGWNYLINRMGWADVEYSQNTVKNVIFIQEAPIDIYKIKKGKNKCFPPIRQPLLLHMYSLLLAFFWFIYQNIGDWLSRCRVTKWSTYFLVKYFIAS